MRHALALGALILLAACGQSAEKAEDAAAANPEKLGQMGPPDEARTPVSFEGRWAPSPDLCAGGPYVFEAQRLTAPGGVVCTFQRVNPITGGYDLVANCAADQPDEKSQIKLGLTDGQQMTVNGGPWSETVTLMRCPA